VNQLNLDQNYIGRIIGPRGSTQKKLELESGCKISIRGKGSSRTRKLELDSDDKVHVLLQADTDIQLEKGAILIQNILDGLDDDKQTATSSKLGDLQIAINIINKDICDYCHEKGHNSWNCTNK